MPLLDARCLFRAAMTNQELIDAGNRTMDETDQAIERSKQVRGYAVKHVLACIMHNALTIASLPR